MKTRTLTTLSELNAVAREVLEQCVPKAAAVCVALRGDLGAGKTAFTKEVAKILGVPNEITSPTFVIMKSYEIPAHPFFKKLIHIDAYRIEKDEEMRVLGFGDLLKDPTHLVCIEWPEKIENLIPKNAFQVSLALNPDETRTITYGN